MKKTIFILGLLFLISHTYAQKDGLTPDDSLARGVLKELVEINTTHSTGNTTLTTEALAKRLLSAGFPEKDIQILGPEARNRNLVLRLHGSGQGRPILFIAHLDVVEAKREDWTFDPVKLTEQDGYFYGRGTLDVKDGAAIMVTDFIRLKKEGYRPKRDLILALTAGEEVGDLYNGMEWLIANQHELIDAEFCINMDAGNPSLKNGKRIAMIMQTSEKGYMNLQLEVKNPGGHSSLPSKNNAIYTLAKGLTKLAAYDFPVSFDVTTKSNFYSMSSLETGQLAADLKAVSGNPADTGAIRRLSNVPVYNSKMRNTCVATILEAGHEVSALPQRAIAKLNCRILPGGKQEDVTKQINSVLGDSQIVVTVINGLKNNPASELNPVLMKMVDQVIAKLWNGIPVIPLMSPGATDGLYLRMAGIPTFGVSGVGVEAGENRAHGKDERILVKAFYDGLEFEYALLKAVGGE